ncbi:hypothetical protein DSO57_1023026 [Entomophthora muscae]|uniref:Uncharacterized protein n=1 Tax=Entomophthora muscae TaxID=34485 RepID=A0ACC2UCU0_9FUNG|nr:hypothetical protein DSO57_1023026 [Entomophthora muscae]
MQPAKPCFSSTNFDSLKPRAFGFFDKNTAEESHEILALDKLIFTLWHCVLDCLDKPLLPFVVALRDMLSSLFFFSEDGF